MLPLLLMGQKGVPLDNVVIRNATRINSPGSEFSPVSYQDGLVYVTSRQRSGPVDAVTGETYYELYYAELDRDRMPLKPEPFSVQLNSQLHEGPVSFDRHANRMYFTRSNQVLGVGRADSQGKIRLKIYEAIRGPYDWEQIKPLPFNGDSYSCMHPALSPDGEKLYFASDRPGGYGGWDIYVVEREGNSWSAPINLGPEINTAKNEGFPFIHDNGVLFFSSNGHRGMGGIDLYMIDISSNTWGNLIQLGAPVNSESDDFGLFLTDDQHGYFSSNRPGGLGKDDIYQFDARVGLQGMKPAGPLASRLVVIDKVTRRPLPGVAVRIFEQTPEGEVTEAQLYNLELFPDDGASGQMNLRRVLKPEAQLGEPRLVTGKNGDGVFQVADDKSYLLLVTKSGYQTQEVAFEPRLQPDNAALEIQLEPSNCISLSGKVLDIEHQDAPIAHPLVRINNDCDNQEILVRGNADGSYDYCLAIGCNYVIRAEKEGYQWSEVAVSTMNVRGTRSFSANVRLKPGIGGGSSEEPALAEGSVIILENIYYDFNKATIRRGETRDLEALAQLMLQFKSMEIELGAHTDSRGTAEYNLQLSLRRAEAARQFLVKRGIEPFRIRVFGYGESQPRNRCVDGVDCSEEEHQFNRRVEVRVLRIDGPVKATELQRNKQNKPD